MKNPNRITQSSVSPLLLSLPGWPRHLHITDFFAVSSVHNGNLVAHLTAFARSVNMAIVVVSGDSGEAVLSDMHQVVLPVGTIIATNAIDTAQNDKIVRTRNSDGAPSKSMPFDC